MAAVSNEDISVAFAHDQLLDDQQSGHMEADSPHFLSIPPGILKSAKFGIVRKQCQAVIVSCEGVCREGLRTLCQPRKKKTTSMHIMLPEYL